MNDALLDTVLDALLGMQPPPAVFALTDTGLLAALPACVPVRSVQPTGCESMLELVVPADLLAVVAGWERAIVTGGAQATIHLLASPEREVTLHYVDARHRFGVFLGFIVGYDGPLDGGAGKAPLFRKRLCVIERDERSVIRNVDAAACEMLGYSAAELIGMRTLDLMHPDDQTGAIAAWMMMLVRPGSHARMRVRYRHRDGRWMWFESTHENRLNDPSHPKVSTELVDISETVASEEALHASEQLLRRLTEALPLGVVQIDAQRQIVYRNERLAAIAGRRVAGSIDEQLCNVILADRESLEGALNSVLHAGAAADIEVALLLGESRRHCSLAMRALTAETGAITGAIICLADITDSTLLRKELEIRATYDALTGCQNRVSILAALGTLLHGPQTTQAGIAVLFVDLDHFKAINDRFGHAAGDVLLQRTAERLLAAARARDSVGRLGGDEFLIVCANVTTPQRALDIARRIASAVTEDIAIGAEILQPGASIGVAWTNTAVSVEVLVAQADTAMYESKRCGAGPVLAGQPGEVSATVRG